MAALTHKLDPLHFVVIDNTAPPREEVARIAYELSERRGFVPGHELEDWIAAEAELRQRQLSS